MAYTKQLISHAPKTALYLLILLSTSFTIGTARRILDEAPPPTTAVPLTPEKTPDVAGAPTVAAASAVPDVKSGTIPPTSEPLTFFMHEILGGSHACARVVTGVVPAAAGSAQLPFGKPNTGVFPTNGAGGVPLPNTNIPFATSSNGAVITNTNNANPFGINGQTTGAGVISGAGGSSIVTGGSRLPYVAGGQLPAGSTLQKLLFGTVTVIDDELSEGHEAGTGAVGRAQGFYVASSEDGTSQSMLFTAMFESGHYEDSISFFGVHRIVSEESQIAVIGGTGKYSNAKGYATVKTLPAVEEHTTDGVESLLQISVYLS